MENVAAGSMIFSIKSPLLNIVSLLFPPPVYFFFLHDSSVCAEPFILPLSSSFGHSWIRFEITDSFSQINCGEALKNTCDNCLATKQYGWQSVPGKLEFRRCTGCKVYSYCSKVRILHDIDHNL